MKDASISMYGKPWKVNDTVKFLGVHVDLSMKLHVEQIERASLKSRKRITKVNSISATLLIHLYKIFVRPYIDTVVRL